MQTNCRAQLSRESCNAHYTAQGCAVSLQVESHLAESEYKRVNYARNP